MLTFWPLMGLALSAFTSATVLPGSSELALGALARQYPQAWGILWLVAGLANTLGALTTYALGCLAQRQPTPATTTHPWLQRYGAWALLGSWIPLIGDGLCFGAGWIGIPLRHAIGTIALAKFCRYGMVLALMNNL